MQATILQTNLQGTVKAIASKSHVHRLLICAALSERPSQILCSETSKDMEATAACLRALGADIQRDREGFAVKPIPAKNADLQCALHCGESGSTLRFMLPVVCALGGEFALYGEGRLPQRPLSPLYELLEEHGCVLSPQGSNPLLVQGKLQSGVYRMPGNVCSQFVSGLLFALPLLDGDSELHLDGKVESQPYIRMTLQALAQAGIQIRQEAQSFYIPGGQTYRTPERCCAEGDWSNAAFWLCAGGLSEQTVCCTNLDKHSLQGDKAVAELLSVFGAKVDWQGDACCVQTAPLQGIRIDAADIPDLVPVLAVVACGAEGETVITNAQRLRLKESDRLQTVYEMLYALGADITMHEDGFRIVGKGCLKGGTVEAHGDHRIAMAAAVAACICQQPVTVCGAQAVQKSYPGFFEDMQSLGAQIMLEEI